jgi:ATP synthase protein I
MSSGRPDPSDMGRYLVLAQAGMEMVAPIAIGVAVDYYFNCSPWGAVLGTLLGFAGGLTHLLMMLKRLEEKRPGPPPADPGA